MQIDIDRYQQYGAKQKRVLGDQPGDPWVELVPFPESRKKTRILPGGIQEISGAIELDKFLYCVRGWGNLLDANNEPLPCTPEVKRLIFEHNIEMIPTRVSLELIKMENELEEELKNLQAGRGGSSAAGSNQPANDATATSETEPKSIATE